MNKSPICYFGGKYYMRKEIIKRIPEHVCYCEPFFGSGQVFFGKEPSRVEVVNDIYDDLVTFFQVLKTCPGDLLEELRYELYSRTLFERYKRELEVDRKKLTPVQRAIRVYYILKVSYGGMRKNFKVMTTIRPSLIPMGIEEIFLTAHERLRYAIIENRDYREVIEVFDKGHTFFFFDPPYNVDGAKCYPRYFEKRDFLEFRDICKGLSGKFLLTINDNAYIRDLFQGFTIEEVPVRYSVPSKERKRFRELIIMNY